MRTLLVSILVFFGALSPPASARAWQPAKTATSRAAVTPRAVRSTAGQLRVRDPRRRPPQLTSFNLDWDDNTIVMPTKIWMKSDATGKEEGLSTADWAIARGHFAPNAQNTALVGSGRYQGFQIGLDHQTGGLRDFYDGPGKGNLFLRDLKAALAEPERSWQGLSWNAFVAAMRRPETARRTSFITARGQSPDTLYEGLKLLQRRGLVKYLPPKENIFPVQSPGFVANGHTLADKSSSELKTEVMKKLLDQVQSNGFGRNAVSVLAPDGQSRRKMQLWGFSDDDYGNFDAAVKALSPEIKSGRWPDVKVKLFFTGKNNPAETPHAVVLMPDGSTRAELPGERTEVTQILGPWKR